MDYNSSIRTRRPIRNNNYTNNYNDYDNDFEQPESPLAPPINNRFNYQQHQHVNIVYDDSDNSVDDDNDEDDNNNNNNEYLQQYYNVGETSKKEKAKMEGSGIGMGHGYYGKWGFFKKMDMLLSPKRQHNGLPCGVDSGEYVFMNTKVYLNQSNALDEMRDSPGESEVDEDEDDDEEDEDGDGLNEEDEQGFKLLAESVQNFGEIYEKIEGRKRQQMLELVKMRMDFQRELELQKKVILERAQAEIAKIREDDDDANSVENLSG